MALEWNRYIRTNHWANFASEKIYYLKTASHLRDYESKLEKFENSNQTMSQVPVGGGGFTNRELAAKTTDQLRSAATNVRPAAEVALSSAAPNATPQQNPICPPTITQQHHPSAFVGRVPQVVEPPAQPAAAAIQRCGRCSKSKSGPDHITRSACNSENYCLAFGKLNAIQKQELKLLGKALLQL